MEKTRRGQEDYPVVKTTQYLTGLTTSQDVWSEVGRALCSFFGTDVVAFGERRADGEITTHHWTFLDPDFGETLSSAVEPPGQADVDQSGIGAEIKAAIAETLECGFLTSRLISTPESASIAFLPLIRENQVAAVMLVGHRTAEPLPKELLNVYLAVASLVGTTTARIASERELRKHRQHLETLVQQRTAELTQVNEQLQQEIIQRQRAEADHARASETLRKRMKELTCLYAVSRDMQQDLSVDELCRRAVEHLAPAMQFPEIAVPVIELNDSRFTRDGYRKGLCHSLQAEISVQGQVRGRVRVYYTEERPFSFPEEQNLVHAIAENLGRWMERKEAEREMRVKDEAIACAINAIAIADPQGNLTYVNPSFVDMWGYDEEQEVLGKSALDFWRRTEDAAEIMRSLQEGEGVVGELTGTRKDGSTFDAQLSASLVADNEGKPVCMMASFVDISERKRAEERVAHLNRVLRSIRDVNQLIVRETDPDRLIQGACDNLIETRGYHNAWIALFDESGELRATAEAGLGEGFSPLVEQFERGELPVCGQRALTQSSVAVIQDPPSSCTVCPLAANYGDRGAMTARLEHGETYYGLLTVSIPAHLAVDEEEQDLLQEVADDLAFALHDIQLEQERRRGEQALRESEKEYRRLIETLNEGIWRIDAEGHTTFVNPKMAEMLGHTVEEMEGEHLFAFMDDEWVEEAQDKLKRRQQGVTEVHEFTFRKKSGESAHMLLSTSSIFDERGEYAGALAGVTDITQRKRAEANVARTAEALRESEAVLNEAQEIAGVGSFVWDLRTDALRWSRHMFTIAGLDPDAFYANLQDTINNMIHPDDRASVQQQIAAMMEQKRTWPMEFRLVRPDGDVRWLRSGSRFTFDEQGTPIECIGVHHDITERKRAEEERARLTARVHEQAQQMAQVLATVPAGVVLLDAQGRILQANPTAEKDLVVLARANVGDVLTRLGKRPLAELLTPPPARGLWHEVKVNERTFEIIAQPVENGPQPKQWVLVINDATQEREIRAQLQQQERLAAVGQLAAGIAHDFNNIMAAIILYAQMAARSEALPQRDRERMAVIDQQARHATHLIEQILDFSRRAMLERRPLDLQPLLKEQVKLLKRTLPEHIGIELAYGREEYTVDADPTRMQQMLTNLAVNARDAMPDGGTLRIGLERIAVEPGPSSPLPEAAPGDWIRLTVSDTGTGIPADALPHIFEPFFTTKGPGEGSGLGLAQVHGIVGQHGGRVDVESQIGEGTTFVIYLPALEARPVEPSPTDAPIPPRGQGQVVLIVEDEGAVRTALVASLEQWNYRTLEATNGEEALDVMERQGGQVSLVLSDVVMPEMGGIALFRALRERGRRTPVILLTGHPMDKKDLDELWGQGLSACLTKPPNIERLAQAVADALQT